MNNAKQPNDQFGNPPRAVLLALDDVVKAGETEDNAVFAKAAQAFLRELQAQTDARSLSEWDPLAVLLAFEEALEADRDLDRAAAVKTIRLYITFQRHEQASLN